MDPDQTAPLCKNRFEKSARIVNRRHKQATFSDAVFLGALRVNARVVLEMFCGTGTVDSRYLEFQGIRCNTSRYPYLDISELRE